MPEGLAINRRWVLVLNNGTVVIDWGDGVFQDIHNGEFLENISLVGSHTILDEELEWMKRMANVAGFDDTNVYVSNLPEFPKKTID